MTWRLDRMAKGLAKRLGLRGWLLGAGLCLLVSCASIDSRTMQYVGAPLYPPSDPAAVQILRSPPAQPHDQLGEIMIDASTDPSPPIQAIEERLRKRAAKLGADAVVVVHDRIERVGSMVSGGYWYRSEYPVIGRRLIGVAIKYRAGPPPPPPPPSEPQSLPAQPPPQPPPSQ